MKQEREGYNAHLYQAACAYSPGSQHLGDGMTSSVICLMVMISKAHRPSVHSKLKSVGSRGCE